MPVGGVEHFCVATHEVKPCTGHEVGGQLREQESEIDGNVGDACRCQGSGSRGQRGGIISGRKRDDRARYQGDRDGAGRADGKPPRHPIRAVQRQRRAGRRSVRG